MRDLEVRRSMIWSARFPALIGAPREPLLPLQVFDVLSCNSTQLRYISTNTFTFSMCECRGDALSLKIRLHRVDTRNVAVNDSIPQTLSPTLTQWDNWYLAS
jgi:hypothetical protein